MQGFTVSDLACAAFAACAIGCCALAGCGAEPTHFEAADPANADEIVGGTAYSGLPAVGALFVDSHPYCTGTLISERTVLTAAHCVVGVGAYRMKFRIGADAYAPTALIAVNSLTPHPDFDRDQLLNDIALVQLKTSATPTPLPLLDSMDDSMVGTRLFFVGYGVTNGTSQLGAGRKRAVWIPIADMDDTRFAYASPNKNTCNGDSGGPALYKNASGKYFVAGVTSYGDQGCTVFGVDTRVDAFLDFVGG